MPKSQGYKNKTRKLLSKKPREHGKLGLSKILQRYEPGDKVVITIDPSVHKGMPHRRYQGRVGVIKSKRGRAYAVDVTLEDAVKEIIVRPEHLKMFEEEKMNVQ
ncbi:MAG: 50S ribosomal protein L21e [Candidatus Bathyarchaeia archaeon]|nr:50S ribosomal protein L21e [Candidatus Bathyarchaeota archaeon]